MITAMIAMAEGLNLSLVAGGVETADQTRCLHHLGCTPGRTIYLAALSPA